MPHKDREVRLEYLRQWRQRNKEQHRAAIERWATENPERHRQISLKSSQRYREKNREKVAKAAAEARARAPHKHLAAVARHRAVHRERINAEMSAYRKANRAILRPRQRAAWKRQYHAKPGFRIAQNLRTKIRRALKRAGGQSPVGLVALLGCSIAELVVFLEAKFAPGMSWDNRGEWHIDHIRPCASFDLTNIDQQRQAFHHTNLQPLWVLDNLRKGTRYSCPEVEMGSRLQ